MCIRKIISKIIHTEKLKLEIIDKIFDIGNCIRFDLINATLLFQSLFCTFWCCFTLFSTVCNPFMQFWAYLIWFSAVFSAKSEFCKNLDKNHQTQLMKAKNQSFQIINIEFRPLEIISDLKELSMSILLSKLPGKISKKYRYQTNDVSLIPTFGTNKVTLVQQKQKPKLQHTSKHWSNFPCFGWNCLRNTYLCPIKIPLVIARPVLEVHFHIATPSLLGLKW